MNRAALLAGLGLVAAMAGAVAQTVDSVARDADTVAGPSRPLPDRFPVGERLLFDGKFGPIRLGRASMHVVGLDTVRGDPTIHFRFLMNANLAGLYRMNNRFDSWVGREDFYSRRFIQDYDESNQKRTNVYEIYPDSAIYTRPDVDTALASTANPLDDTAFFYFVRTLDLEPGQRFEFNRYFRPDRNPVIIEVLERDTIDVPAGRFETVVIHPIIKGGGIFKESANARMWISDDPRRLIVQMKSNFAFGTVTLRLTGTEGPSEAAASGPSD